MAFVLLSASVERYSVSCMLDFFVSVLLSVYIEKFSVSRMRDFSKIHICWTTKNQVFEKVQFFILIFLSYPHILIYKNALILGLKIFHTPTKIIRDLSRAKSNQSRTVWRWETTRKLPIWEMFPLLDITSLLFNSVQMFWTVDSGQCPVKQNGKTL